MRKLYENFHILHFHKRIVSVETIHRNKVIKHSHCIGLKNPYEASFFLKKLSMVIFEVLIYFCIIRIKNFVEVNSVDCTFYYHNY